MIYFTTSSINKIGIWTPSQLTFPMKQGGTIIQGMSVLCYTLFQYRAAQGVTHNTSPHTGQHKVYEHFEKNVLKIVCYGHDERKGGTAYGDCVHPCNARKGCEFMSNKYDGNR